MRHKEGENHIVDVEDGVARARVWMRPDLTAERGAALSRELAASLVELAERRGVRAAILDLREAPPVIGPITRGVLAGAISAWEQHDKRIALLVSNHPTQLTQMRKLVEETAPRGGFVTESVPDAERDTQPRSSMKIPLMRSPSTSSFKAVRRGDGDSLSALCAGPGDPCYAAGVSILGTLIAALRLALRAVARAKLRATLTVLGILIGVAAVVTVTALGTGARERIAKQIEDFGSNTLYINPQATQVSGAKQKSQGRLTEADARAVLREATSVVAVAPFLSTQAQIVFGDRNTATTVMGSTRDYFHVRKFTVGRGNTWTEQDERMKSKVIVIGATTAETLCGTQDPVGAVVRSGRHPYRIIGLLDRKGPSPFGEDQDDRVLMPSASFRARVRPMGPGRVDFIMASASSADTVGRAEEQIGAILRQRHGTDDLGQPDFTVRTQREFRESQEAIYGVLSALLVSVAAVSLFVGGIGVMNIMLVSVTERTREIGIRMAIGASERDILLQFLVEAVVLALLGGIAGTLLGLVAVYAFASALGWSMRVPVDALIVALVTSAAIGVTFGFLPARRAARLDPIDALRQE